MHTFSSQQTIKNTGRSFPLSLWVWFHQRLQAPHEHSRLFCHTFGLVLTHKHVRAPSNRVQADSQHVASRQSLSILFFFIIFYSCCVSVGFLSVAFAVWATFGRKPPVNCRLAVLNAVLMDSFELGGFLVRKCGVCTQDPFYVWLAADFSCFIY